MKLAAILFTLFVYGLVARYLYTGRIPQGGYGKGILRSEQPMLYWLGIMCYSGFATLCVVELCTGKIR